jgi:hypothetical protein
MFEIFCLDCNNTLGYMFLEDTLGYMFLEVSLYFFKKTNIIEYICLDGFNINMMENAIVHDLVFYF